MISGGFCKPWKRGTETRRKDGIKMKNGWTGRIVCLALALLLCAGYLFLPNAETQTFLGEGGRKKTEIPTDEKLTWTWKPETEQPGELSFLLSGKKKAAGMTVHARLTDEEGNEAAAVSQAVDEMGDADGITLTGSFSAGKTYELSLWAEGDGTIKVKGDEDEEGNFTPTLSESGTALRRNPVVLYFATGLLMLALIPGGKKAGKRTTRKKWDGNLLALGVFALILTVGLLVCLRKPVFYQGSPWGGWDEEIHESTIRDMTIAVGSVPRWLARLVTWFPGYLPSILGESLTWLFTQKGDVIYRAGILSSSLGYAVMAALAVKHAPRYKATFLVAGTMPVILFLMTCLTYDTMVIGSILLGLALVLETIDREETASAPRLMLMTALLSFGTLAKPAYSLAVLALLMIPADRLGGKKQAWLFRVLVIGMTVWSLAAVALPGAYDEIKGGDERFAGTDSAAQIANILAHPETELIKPFRELWESQDLLMNWGISHWAYLGNDGYRNQLYLALLLVASPLCVWERRKDERNLLTVGRRIGLGAIAFGAELILLATQFIVSSPVGGGICGMQARYFIPVWISLALAVTAPKALRDRVDLRAGKLVTWLLLAAAAQLNISYALGWLRSTGCL